MCHHRDPPSCPRLHRRLRHPRNQQNLNVSRTPTGSLDRQQVPRQSCLSHTRSRPAPVTFRTMLFRLSNEPSTKSFCQSSSAPNVEVPSAICVVVDWKRSESALVQMTLSFRAVSQTQHNFGAMNQDTCRRDVHGALSPPSRHDLVLTHTPYMLGLLCCP